MNQSKTKEFGADPQQLLSEIKIATPCTASWEKMTGDERGRFCGQCQKNVYNLSTMTAQDALDLIKAKEGKVCVRFFQRFDGTVLTADCPVGIKDRARRLWWRVTTIAATIMASIYLVSCGSKSNQESCLTKTNQTREPHLREIKGGIPSRHFETNYK